MMVAGRGRKRVFHNRERKKGDELERASERERVTVGIGREQKRHFPVFACSRSRTGNPIQGIYAAENTAEKNNLGLLV